MSLATQVLGELPAGERVFAVLDGASNPFIRGWVFDTRQPRWCLYRGALPAELEDAAPWLMLLPRAGPCTEQFFDRFWGRSCAILLASPADPRLVRRHLRRFLLARSEEGDELLFRYYDPRILQVYLPSCTPAEVTHFFGPISTFAAEGEDPGAVDFFRSAAAGLVHKQRLP